MISQKFWAQQKVLVTGCTGFKGAWLSLCLSRLGSKVSGVALPPPTNPSLFQTAGVGSDIEYSIVDIRDFKALEQAVRRLQPEVVFHLAAQALVRPSYEDPIGTYMTNVMGTVHLLETVRRVPSIRAVVIVTSDKCYENQEWHWAYRENEAMGGYDPYSSSKGCAELVTSAYRRSFFPPQQHSEHLVGVASARAGNVIGGGDWSRDRLVPDIALSLADDRVLEIRNPNAIRPWQHVLDPLAGYLMLAERLVSDGPKYSEGFNFGPPEVNARPVQDIVNQFLASWGLPKRDWKVSDMPQPHEAKFLKLDSSKAQGLLGWQSKLEIQKALDWTTEWYRSYYRDPSSAREATIQQIDRYLGL